MARPPAGEGLFRAPRFGTAWAPVAALAAAGCGGARLVPFWPRAGLPAKRALLQAWREGRGPARIEPGLTLHADAGFTPAAEAVLRDGAALPG
ncbi:hypothetical protein [Paracraurococcus ruber]|uniref:Uncharacterized protein n=1 Tax=Paracraurococcus ruber TaxID=77675 RepID=A0ABS1CW74_9PROT|nr:hypothetical protein [Paracraurococcus ruber]MBK1658202.1 hypothetical protein [Paracraurococcus ruber]